MPGPYKTELMNANGFYTTLFGHSTRKYKHEDIIIAFIGLTGGGKSQIIDTLTGQPGRRAKDSLKSVTKDLEASRILDHERYGSRIILVDTPGFDDTNGRSDEQILKMIGEWLEKTYKKQVLLSGIVYVHRISELRMAATPQRNIHMFEELTGARSAKNVVLATTLWDKLTEPDEGDNREKGLKEEYWNGMIDHGAAIERFLNTSDSAWGIIDNIVNKNEQKATLLFQEERVNQKKSFMQTRARQALFRKPIS